MLNAASLLELKFSPQSDSGCIDCIWKDIPSECLLLSSISVWLSVLFGLSALASCISAANSG